MTSRLRGSAKEEPKTSSLLSSHNRTYLSSNREPREKSSFEGSRNKVSRKDSRGKYDSLPERSTHTKYETNGFRSMGANLDEDPDLLYRRSRDHFGSWNIQDIIGAGEVSPGRSKSDRKSRFDLFKSDGDESKKIANGNARTRRKSSDRPESQVQREKRSDSNGRKYSQSRSPDLDRDRYKLNEKTAPDKSQIQDKTRRKSPGKEIDRTINQPRYGDEGHPPRNRALLREIENFGANRREFGRSNNESPERHTSERRYAGNSFSPERENDKIRQLIERFKSTEQNNDAHDSSWRKSERYRSPSLENDKYRVTIRSGDRIGSADRTLSKDESNDWKSRTGARYPSLDRKASHRISHVADEKIKENHENKEFSRFENNERNCNGEYRRGDSETRTHKFMEREHRINGDSRGSSEEGGFRKRSDTYSVERGGSGPRKPRDLEEDSKESSKRKSHVYSDSPDNFDVQIQRYERALTGPRKDPELSRKNSAKERDSEVRRRSSLKIRDEPDENLERNGRHSRPLTPPEDSNVLRNDRKFQDNGTTFNTKNWYESNKRFAAKYLEENSKVNRVVADDRTENNSEIRRISPTREIYFGDHRSGLRNASEENHNQKYVSSLRMKATENFHERNSDPKLDRKSNGRGEPTTIKIRNIPEERSENERRMKRGIFLETEEDSTNGRNRKKSEENFNRKDGRWNRNKDWTSGTATPARKIWSYREGGAQITDVDEGQPCLKCGETCPGFLQHSWRRHTTPTLLAGEAAVKMSPKGPTQDGPKTEVRVCCVPSPGAEPLGIRVRIPEPKRPTSPPQKLQEMRERCPSVPEKDLYRKSSSLDRRERYPTLSGADIRRGLMGVPSELSKVKRNPMLDRRHRYPTLSGAELRRGFAIGKCPLEDGLDLSLAPWPGMRWACVRVLHLYCKVFDQFELFELIVRKNCNSCKCPREAHDVCHDEWVSVRSRLGLKGDGVSGSVSCEPRDLGLAWAPPGLPSHKVEEYFSMLPEVSVPRLGTPGERYRDRQLAMQLPKQDLAKAYCRHLAPEHYTSADDFMAARNEIALDIGTVQEILETGTNCAGCNEGLKYGSLAVSAGKLGELYHPACFQCVQCRELLVDLAYCVYNDAVYCERHYAERLKGRCPACDELIFSGEFTRAMNKDWHSGHFCCWQCDESLTGQRYVLRDEHPYCIKCYESVFANGCEECSKIIGIDSKDLSYKDKHWHEACFLCNKCRVSLVDKQFGSKVDKIYCGNCYDAQFASRCDGCGEIFRAGTKKMEYKTRQWHEKCFCCVVCKNPIGTKSFIPREQEIYCAGCYEDKFATRCVKCNKIITSGGVTYKNEPWHRECFTCSNCSTSLAGQRFTSRDEKPYCADCFGELFAKRCTACTKPITGIGGTRFISFEDRHWHNDCFICAGCKTSLVGRGFITDADDVICPECAKQKLM